MLFRSAHDKDLDAIHKLAQHSGIGITTLPKEKEILAKRLDLSCRSFHKNVESLQNEYYLFVLEAPATGQLIGISAIEAAVGYELPFYSYKLIKHHRICPSLNIRSVHDMLKLGKDKHGHSELCTLFLVEDYRKKHNGLLLSLARLLFMAQFPNRFAQNVIGEMRGISDEQGNSPFWESVGRHFFQMPFAKADRLTLSTNKQFIADLMPRNPIYISLLSKKAQAVIGKPHPSTVPAMTILLREGFRYKFYVDIFDAGPTIEAPFSQIQTIATSRVYQIGQLQEEVASPPTLISNTKIDFRATMNQAICNQENETCIISRKTAQLLQVNVGDYLRIKPLQIKEPKHECS